MMKTLFFETIDSTNTFLKEHYSEYEDMTFVSAGVQTAGRGRNGREWKASEGKDLTFSLLIKDEEVMEQYKILSVLSAYSVLKVLESCGVKDLSIKWPNDVYAGGRKICGILLEGISGEKMECLIIGIGINVNEDSFEGEYLHTPTSMKLQLDRQIDLDGFRDRIYRELIDRIDGLKKGTDLYPLIRDYDYLRGKTVFAEVRGIRKEVSVLGIDENGSLEVECEGEILHLTSSEVTFHL